jgi:hypothetical protein
MIRATSSTMGQANPSPLTLSKPYRRHRDPDWDPARVVFREAGRARLSPQNRNSKEQRAERYRRFCALTDLGWDLPKIAAEMQIAIQTARTYRRQYLAAKAGGES